MLTVIADVRLPFLVFGVAVALSSLALRTSSSTSRAAAARRSARADRRVLRRLLARRRLIAALLVVVSFRYSGRRVRAAVGDVPRRPRGEHDGHHLSLTVFALPMLVIARWAGRLSDTYGPRLTSVLAAAATVPLMALYGYVGSCRW